MCEGLISGEACPRAGVNRLEADERMGTDYGCARGRLMVRHVRVRLVNGL